MRWWFLETDKEPMVSEESTSNGRVSMMDKMKSMVSEDLNCTPDKYYRAFKKQKTNLPR